MPARHHEIFEAIRDDVIDHLAGARGVVDAGARAPNGRRDEGEHAPQRAHIGGVVAKMQRFVETGDLGRYREFLHRWAVVRLGEGGSPESILHAVTAIGDTVIQIAFERVGQIPELGAFARDVARASFWATRLTVEVLAEELGRREREHLELVEAGVG
jgi:hypothetical protein